MLLLGGDASATSHQTIRGTPGAKHNGQQAVQKKLKNALLMASALHTGTGIDPPALCTMAATGCDLSPLAVRRPLSKHPIKVSETCEAGIRRCVNELDQCIQTCQEKQRPRNVCRKTDCAANRQQAERGHLLSLARAKSDQTYRCYNSPGKYVISC